MARAITIEIDTSRLSRGQLARTTGYDRSHISRVLSGQRRPSLECARKLAEALGYSIDDFYDWWTRTFKEE